MTARLTAALTLVLVATSFSLIDAQRFTSRAFGVRVDVLVTNGRQPVTGLTARDFELRDDGVAQEVAELDHEQLPLNLILVFDTSSSVAGSRMRSLLEAAEALLGELRKQDRVAVLSFASRVRLLAPLTPSREQVRAAFRALNANGATSLRDAAFAGLALRDADPGRTLVLIFSDGADTSSWLTAPQVIEATKRTDAVVYAVAVTREDTVTRPNTPAPSGGGVLSAVRKLSEVTFAVKDAGKFLERLTDESGGRVLFATSEADLRAAFTKTLAEFRDRYVLSYTPTGVAATGWHRLDVTLKGKKGKVTARRGYFAE
jgi:VWFA-related protein